MAGQLRRMVAETTAAPRRPTVVVLTDVVLLRATVADILLRPTAVVALLCLPTVEAVVARRVDTAAEAALPVAEAVAMPQRLLIAAVEAEAVATLAAATTADVTKQSFIAGSDTPPVLGGVFF